LLMWDMDYVIACDYGILFHDTVYQNSTKVMLL